MRALVTGATGFIGSNVARELAAAGYQVRALVRPGSNRANLEGLDVELVEGDVTQPVTLGPALQGCHALFHVAAAYTFWHPKPQVLYQANVQGTENTLAAARKAGLERVVYTSSVAAVGHPRHGGQGDEACLAHLKEMVGHYKRSKYLAEQVALKFAKDGLPVVIVNPSTPLGPGDIKPTPTGRIVVDFLNGRMPAYINTGLNFVHVRDVARGHILALEKGRPGERYILGNANLTLRQVLQDLAALTGLPSPRVRLPYAVALGLASLDRALESWLLRREPRIPLEGVRMSRQPMYFDPSKAVRDLGLPQTAIAEALADAVRWFVERGYVAPARQARLRLKTAKQARPV